ncbi:hypothetical protein S7711_10564 [Stachybotrys chartarum IBT 7711]|uniref:Uncharacterized protein n=1 Tax=Stachybotrys chartarum (strain CBS 109288 / IBT 7711) TaxID=1280523 RepID=A0A084B0Z5_STACB|nr:hypothetical protein S7711_10564 [Stachybotrys chartarum IBT 7711]
MTASATSSHLPCLMAAHKPSRYSEVQENCKTQKGFNNIATTLQHMIKCHMHICRKCKKERNPGACVKSKKGLANPSSIDIHQSCVHQPWASKEEELKHPELLTESQEKLIMNWDKRSAKKRLGSSDVDDTKLWEELYFSLHNEKPGKLGAAWTYHVPRHIMDEEIKSLNKTIASLKSQIFKMMLQSSSATQCVNGSPPNDLSYVGGHIDNFETGFFDDANIDGTFNDLANLTPTPYEFNTQAEEMAGPGLQCVLPYPTPMHSAQVMGEELKKMEWFAAPDSGFSSENRETETAYSEEALQPH